MQMHRIGKFMAVVLLVAITTPASAAFITGYGEYGNSFSGEAGGFTYVQLNTADPGVSLAKATFDFSSLGLNSTASGIGVPTINNGVTSFSTFVTSTHPAVFGFTATGFNAGDNLLLQAIHVDGPTGSIPLASDLFGAKLNVQFSDGTVLTGTFDRQGRNQLAVIADFSSNAPVPEPSALVMSGTAMLIGLGCWWCRRKRAVARACRLALHSRRDPPGHP